MNIIYIYTLLYIILDSILIYGLYSKDLEKTKCILVLFTTLITFGIIILFYFILNGKNACDLSKTFLCNPAKKVNFKNIKVI